MNIDTLNIHDCQPILDTDSYKLTHDPMYPPGDGYIDSYLESRGGLFPKTVAALFGYYVREVLGTPVSQDHIDEAEEDTKEHFGTSAYFNRDKWNLLKGKYLPLEVRAVPEGLHVPTSNVLMTVRNMDNRFKFLSNHVETRLSQVWYPITVATLSNHCRQIILRHLHQTGTPADIWFKLHDFGFRGASSKETAAIGDAAHLHNFMGTDTLVGCRLLKKYYSSRMAGFSIAASEHSTITSWGQLNELAAYDNFLNKFPERLVACVSDSYNIYNACDKLWGGVLRERVMNRNGTLVIRPDSGHPPEVVMKCLRILGQRFPTTINSKGFRVLDSHVRLIQGDGVDPQMIDLILSVMAINGWSADNIAFGMGGALLQKCTRDTNSFAFKCSHIQGDGYDRDVFKQPVTDKGKNSKPGRLTLYLTDAGEYVTAERGRLDIGTDMMQTYYINGTFPHSSNLDEIRTRVIAQEAVALTPAA